MTTSSYQFQSNVKIVPVVSSCKAHEMCIVSISCVVEYMWCNRHGGCCAFVCSCYWVYVVDYSCFTVALVVTGCIELCVVASQ